ncbi:MAG: PASTA domain-containing protein [Saccharofermentanales bacterium]
MSWKKVLLKGGVAAAKMLAPEAIDLGVKIGSEIYEQQKTLVKIPDLKDVHVEEAIRILKDELHLNPTSAIANPNIGFADESEKEVMYSEPRFGSRVNPGTTVKVYYLTQEVIEASKILLGKSVREFEVPRVIGLNTYEAREDLEGLGLKVTEKLEKPNLVFANKEDGQVTRITYPDDQKIGSKLKSGNRVWLYYVNDQVILDSIIMRDNKYKDKHDMIEKISVVSKNASKGIIAGAIDAPKKLAKNIKNPFKKNKTELDEGE